MRVLVAHCFYRVPGGEDRYVTQQLGLLSGHHQVELLAGENLKLSESATTARRMMFSQAGIARVEAMMKRFRPHVVHVHNVYPSFGPAVHLAAARLGIPLVMTVHNYRMRCPNGFMFTEGRVCRRCEWGLYANAVVHRCFASTTQAGAYALSLWAHRFLLRLDDKVAMFVAPSAFVGKQLRQWGIDSGRVRVIPNFTDAPTASSSQLGAFGVYIGRLSQEKGIDVLLRGLALAGDPPFTIVGDGPQRAMLERLAADLGLRQLRFTGRLAPADVRSVLSAARFAAFPSVWHENSPLAALEAMAAGRPLLVTSRGGLTELAAGGRGLVCSADDPQELADKIRLLYEEEELCQQAGAAALSFACTELSPENHRARLEEVYDTVRADAMSGGR